MRFKKIANYVIDYFRSFYFQLDRIIVICILGGTLATLFPFNDLSFAYILTWSWLLVWLLASFMALVVLLIVSFTWYAIGRSKIRTDTARSRILSVAFGYMLPIGLILLEIYLVFGPDFFKDRDVQYHIWFYIILVVIVNLYFERLTITEQIRQISIRNQVLDEEIIAGEQLRNRNEQLREKIDQLKRENEVMKQDIEKSGNKYVVDTGVGMMAFRRSEVAAFMIRDLKVKGAKPIIDIYLCNGKTYIVHGESLEKIGKKFPEFKRVTRQLLVSPESIKGYHKKENTAVDLILTFKTDLYELNDYQWQKHKDWIQKIADDIMP